MISASWDGTVRRWELPSGDQTVLVGDLPFAIIAMTISVDEGLFAVAMDYGGIRVYDIETRQIVHEFETDNNVSALVFGGNGAQLWGGDSRGNIQQWDIETGNLLETIPRYTAGIGVLTLSPNREHILSASSDGDIQIWSTEYKTLQYQVNVPSGLIDVVYDPSHDHQIAIFNYVSDVYIFNLSSGETVSTIATPHNPGTGVGLVYSPDGQYVITADNEGLLLRWDVFQQVQLEGTNQHTAWINDALFSPDETQIYSVNYEDELMIWDLASGELSEIDFDVPTRIFDLDMNTDKTLMVASSHAMTTSLFDLTTLENFTLINPNDSALFLSTVFLPNTNSIIIADGSTFYRYEASNQSIELMGLPEVELSRWVAPVLAVSLDGHFLTVNDLENGILVFDLFNDLLIGQLGTDLGPIVDITFSPVGNEVAFSSATAIHVWTVEHELREVELLEAPNVDVITFSLDGSIIVIGTHAGDILVWERGVNEPILIIENAHSGIINSIEFNKDGTAFITSSDDGSVRLWGILNG